MNAAEDIGPEESALRARASKRLDELIDEFGEDEVDLLYGSFETHLHGERGYTAGLPSSPADEAQLDAAERWFDAICAEYVRRKDAGTLPFLPSEA